VKLEDLPFDIPDNWMWIRFPNLVNFNLGKTPERHNDKYWSNGKYFWFSIADMIDKETIYTSKEKISDISFKENFGSKLSPAGTLIMSFKLTVGRVSILGVDALHNEAIISIFPYLKNNYSIKNWLFYTLGILVSYVEQTGAIKGNTLNKEKMSSMYIPLPPLEEQQRIIDKINSFEPLLGKYDEVEKELSKLEKEFPEKLKKSILQYAIEGKLVKQDPNDEPASVLLERIKQEKERLIKEGKIKRDKNESYIYQGDDKNYYENLPDSFLITNLSCAGNWRSGSTPARGNKDYYNGDIPWLKTGELNNDIVYDSSEKITQKALNECSLPVNKIGNVLIAMYGATIGKLGIVGRELTTNQACCGCETFNGIYNKYLFYYLMSQKQCFIDAAEGGAQPNISREKIISYPFILMPYNYQLRLVCKLESLFKKYF